MLAKQPPSQAVVRFYNKRGTAEQWIKEGKLAVSWTRLSCHRFRGNEVRLWLSVIAYNLGNLWRRLALPQRIKSWSLTSLQQRLVKTGRRLVKHARYYWLLLAEGHLSRRLFASMLRTDLGTAAARRLATQEKRVILGAQKWSARSVSAARQAGQAKTRTATPKNSQKCALLLPQRGQSCLRLTRQGRRHRFSGEGEAQNGNSGLNLSLAWFEYIFREPGARRLV